MRDERRIVGGLVVLLWLCVSPELAAQCDTFSGQVAADSSYERGVGDGLVFRLRAAANAPPNPAGWTLEVRAGSSEVDLRERIGDSQVERADVHLTEGMCTVGARLFPGTPWEVEVAWSDSLRSRPAFARTSSRAASSDRASTGDVPRNPYRTPAGVGLGTSLETLASIAGGPVRFSGFGWDFGGRVRWTAEGDELILYLAFDRVRLDALRAAGDTGQLEEMFGDRTVASDHPILDRLGVRVVMMRRNWRQPEAVRFCG